MQVINNYINTLSQGILLGWGNYALDLPYAYGNNINNTFSNNQIIGTQISPLTLTSALTVTVAGNSFLDVMCNVFGVFPLLQHQIKFYPQHWADLMPGHHELGKLLQYRLC